MKSNANDAELIAEAYTARRLSVGAAEEDQEKKVRIQNGIYNAVAGAVKSVVGGTKKEGDKMAERMHAGGYPDHKSPRKSEDGESYEDCEHAAQGCDCSDCEQCASNGTSEEAPVVDQEDSCGYDQVAEPVADPAAEAAIHSSLADLHKALKYAATLSDIIGNIGGIDGDSALKIAKAADYLGAVYDKLDYDANGHSMYNTGHEDATH